MSAPLAPKAANIGGETPMQSIQTMGALVVAPQNFGEVMLFADRMAASRFVPAHLRERPADCLAVCMQALRWGMDPFAVAQKTYFTRDGAPPAYEAQLVNAVVYARAPLRGRLRITWDGKWPNRTCTVEGDILGDSDTKTRTVHAVNIKTRNSPLWTTDPDQQLAYYTTRAWARLYVPDVLMGVYTPEDDEMRAERAQDVTPAERPQQPASRIAALEDMIPEPAPAESEPPMEVEQRSFYRGKEMASGSDPAMRSVYDVETGEVPGDVPEPPADERAQAWGNEAIRRLEKAPDSAAIDRWMEKNKAKLAEIHAVAPDVASAVVAVADKRKRELEKEETA